MGSPFNESKKVEHNQKTSRGFFEELILMIFQGIGWLLKHVLVGYASMIKYFWTREEVSQGKASRFGKVVACAMIITPLFFVYKIPMVRDLTLSKHLTINLQQGEQIQLPDRTFFIPDEEERKRFQLPDNPSIEYITYHKELEEKILVMKKGCCQLVPRGKKITVISEDIPIYAVGFESKAAYKMNNSSRFFSERDWNLPPSIDPTYKSGSWYEFRDDWWSMAINKDGRRFPFFIEARSNENAMICF